MRVIAGSAKKRRLKSPGKLPVRPTADRVKEALFNILGERVPGSFFADLYAGTGGVGIEALSRGARKALFVEKNIALIRLLKENIQLAGLSGGAQVVHSPVETVIPKIARCGEKFDIIFADPPYRQGLAEETLNILARYRVWRKNALIVIETWAKDEIPDQAGTIGLWRREKYGDTTLNFYQAGQEED